MPRRCTICNHPQRDAMDQALLTPEPYRSIAQHFAVSPDAVYRHKQDHLPKHLAQAHTAHEVSQADGLMAQLQALTTETQAILREARPSYDPLKPVLVHHRDAGHSAGSA